MLGFWLLGNQITCLIRFQTEMEDTKAKLNGEAKRGQHSKETKETRLKNQDLADKTRRTYTAKKVSALHNKK